MEPRLRASPEQFLALIEFMERHGDISRPQGGAQGRLRGDRLWQELTSIINSVGSGVNKSQEKWKKVWADWKTKSKKKYILMRRHARGTGGGPSSRLTLTALEKRVVAVLGFSAVVGQGSIRKLGFNTTASEPSQQEFHDLLPSTSRAPEADPWTSLPSAPVKSPQSPLSPFLPEPTSPPRRQSHPPPRRAPGSPETPPRRRPQVAARRNRGQTPFDRAASEFAAVEQRRLRLEESRERWLHERETERIAVDRERNHIAREHVDLLRQLTCVLELVLGVLTQNGPSNSLASTDILPD